MFFFDYLRQRARDAVLAGVQDALDQIDPQPGGGPPPASLPVTAAPPQLGHAPGAPAAADPPAVPVADPPAPAGDPTSLQARLAQAADRLAQPPAPPGPAAPKRGRGPHKHQRVADGGEP